MQHIRAISSHQPQVVSLEDTISHYNPVRFIDAFVHSINLERIGFMQRRQTKYSIYRNHAALNILNLDSYFCCAKRKGFERWRGIA